jgi:glycine C-acetyltransferase
LSARTEFYERTQAQLRQIKAQGLYKRDRVITSQQSALIEVAGDEPVLNFCVNNFLGLANHPELISAVCEASRGYGFGMASVRFICGTQPR